MEYRDRAIAAIQEVERELREKLRPIIQDAISADAYAEVALIARLTGDLSKLLAQAIAAPRGFAPESVPFGEEVGSDRSPSADSEENSSIHHKLQLEGVSPRDHYPRFLREGDRLVKIAWSKKDRAPYEHSAPYPVVSALVTAIKKKKGEGILFQAADVLPLKNAQHDEYPSYQSYLALNWLREFGVISKKGREGYVLKPKTNTPEKLDQLWTNLPIRNRNGEM